MLAPSQTAQKTFLRRSPSMSSLSLPVTAHKSAQLGRPQQTGLRYTRKCAIIFVVAVLAAILAIAVLRELLWGGGFSRPVSTALRLDATHRPGVGKLDHLIMVAGHSVFIGTDTADFRNQQNWFLMPYQNNPGQVESFLKHIELGVKAAGQDDGALLVFSGGFTRDSAGARSEAGSYWDVAEAAGWWGHDGVRERAVLEDRARDSFENLLFSLCRFRQFAGRYPARVTVVSYDFKEERFKAVHAASLGYPADRVSFIGTPVPNADAAREGEKATLRAFKSDPYGCASELASKRLTRDPFSVGTPHYSTCPALKPFMSGPCLRTFYTGALPWRDAKFRRGSVLPTVSEERR